MMDSTLRPAAIRQPQRTSSWPKALDHRSFRNAPLTLMAAAVLVAAVALLPLGFVIAMTLQAGGDSIIALVFRRRVGELLLNTLLLESLTVTASLSLGITLAWLTERTDLPGARAWALALAMPLAVPSFVHSYAWVSVLPSMNGLGAAVLVSTLAYFPMAYLPAAAAFRRLDPGLEDEAMSLGLRPHAIFFRVVLPQLRFALCGGMLLIGLHLLAEYGLFAMIRFDTFTTAIMDQFQSTYNSGAANMLAGVLVLCCLGLLIAEAGARGHARYARIGSGAARLPARHRLGGWKPFALALLLAVIGLSVGVPLLTLGRWLLITDASVFTGIEWRGALLQTLGLASVGALLTLVAAIPIGWLSVRFPSRLQRWIEGCNYVAAALPGIVVALALVTIAIRVAPAIYQTTFTVLLAYMLLFLPRALVNLRAGISQTPVELENAAASLGYSPLGVLRSVTLRLAAPGATAGAALVFLAITNELTATLLLAPNGTRTLATGFWSLTGESDYAGAAPYALAMILLSLPLTWLLHIQSKQLAGR